MTGAEHAILMDQVYRRQRYVYDFTRKYYLFGRDRLIARLALTPDQSLVEIGCGTARNLIKIARRYPGTRLYGLDASREMLKTAQEAVARAGLSGQIRLAQGLAEDLSPAMFGLEASFDHAVFSYSLSMIPDWKQALTACARAVGEDGRVHVVDFGDLTGLGSVGSALLTRWLALFHVSPRAEVFHRLESSVQNYTEQKSGLNVFPARYAFIWQGSGKSVRMLQL